MEEGTAPRPLSPGETLRQYFANNLTKDILRRRFPGVDFEADQQIEWDDLADVSVPIENRSIRKALETIVDVFDSIDEVIVDPAQKRLIAEFRRRKKEYKFLEKERLKYYCEQHFDTLFSGAQLAFFAKRKGVQIGYIIHVGGPPPLIYYVKSHSAGHLETTRSVVVQPVSPFELICYKALEISKLGCECSFFGRDTTHCYIATKGAEAAGACTVLENALRMAECVGAWSAFPAGRQAREDEVIAIEAAVEQDTVAQTFARHILTVYVVCRAFGLGDVLTNHDNIVVWCNSTGRLCVVDFRVADQIIVQPHDWFESVVHPSVSDHLPYRGAKDLILYLLFRRDAERRGRDLLAIASDAEGVLHRMTSAVAETIPFVEGLSGRLVDPADLPDSLLLANLAATNVDTLFSSH